MTLEIRDIEAFIKKQKDRDKRIAAAMKRSARILDDALTLHNDLSALIDGPTIHTPDVGGVVMPKPVKKKRAAISPDLAQVNAVNEAVHAILARNPGHAFTPSELVGATHLGKKTIATVFRQCGFIEKRGKFTAPPMESTVTIGTKGLVPTHGDAHASD